MISPRKLTLNYEYPKAKIEIELDSIYFSETNQLFKKITELFETKEKK